MRTPADRTYTDPDVTRLVAETGITESQARELLSILRGNWSSLVREARLLRPTRLGAGSAQ